MAEHRRRRATPSGGGKPLAPFVLQAAQTRLLCCGSSMMLGHHPPRRASYPDPRRLQHGLSDFCHGLLGKGCQRGEKKAAGTHGDGPGDAGTLKPASSAARTMSFVSLDIRPAVPEV